MNRILQKKHIEDIIKVPDELGYNYSIALRDGPARRNPIYDNGYCASHVTGFLKESRLPFEFKISGPKTTEIDKLTELSRSISQGKDFFDVKATGSKDSRLKERIDKIHQAVDKMNQDENCLINCDYQHGLYKQARQLELGKNAAQKVEFPSEYLDDALSEDFLRQTAQMINNG